MSTAFLSARKERLRPYRMISGCSNNEPSLPSQSQPAPAPRGPHPRGSAAPTGKPPARTNHTCFTPEPSNVYKDPAKRHGCCRARLVPSQQNQREEACRARLPSAVHMAVYSAWGLVGFLERLSCLRKGAPLNCGHEWAALRRMTPLAGDVPAGLPCAPGPPALSGPHPQGWWRQGPVDGTPSPPVSGDVCSPPQSAQL